MLKDIYEREQNFAPMVGLATCCTEALPSQLDLGRLNCACRLRSFHFLEPSTRSYNNRRGSFEPNAPVIGLRIIVNEHEATIELSTVRRVTIRNEASSGCERVDVEGMVLNLGRSLKFDGVEAVGRLLDRMNGGSACR